MRNPRKTMIAVSVLGSLFPLARELQAQTHSFPGTIVTPGLSMVPPKSTAPLQSIAPQQPIAPLQHVPSNHSGPIDLSKYSSEVLNCAVCRERLGLPALRPSTETTMKAELVSPATIPTDSLPGQPADRLVKEGDVLPKVGATFGGSGLITAGAAKQLEASGMVIQEFRPPTPNPDDFRLETLPLDARQQFFQQLDLPNGARVMSAQIMSGNQATQKELVAPSTPQPAAKLPSSKSAAPEASVAPVKELADPNGNAEQKNAENLKLVDQLAFAAELQKKKDRQIDELLATNQKILLEVGSAAKERNKLQEMIATQAESFEKKIAEMERNNQETARMLEARTLEVTELQNKLQMRAKSPKNKAKAESENTPKTSKKSSKAH